MLDMSVTSILVLFNIHHVQAFYRDLACSPVRKIKAEERARQIGIIRIAPIQNLR